MTLSISIGWIWLTYLIGSDFAVFTFRVSIDRFSCVFILRKMRRGATSADPIIKEHAIPLLDVKEEFNSLWFVGKAYIVFARIDMQSDWIDLPIANVVTHADLWDNRTCTYHEHPPT